MLDYYQCNLIYSSCESRKQEGLVNKKPIVSVVIPAYNSVRYIKRAIDSVLFQNVPLEIIVINDCSRDNLDQIMEHYKNLHNIIYIKNKMNLGVAKSRNLGVNAASGEYIAFLDADDWWMPNKLIEQIKCMNEKKCVLCYTARQLADDDETLTGIVIHVKELVDYNSLLRHNSISCSSVLIKREVALDNPMDHSELHEDYLTWLKILKKYGNAYGINQPLLIYRLSKTSKTRNKIKSAKMTYGVYRVLNIGRIKAIILMSSHLFHGVIKYSKHGE